MASILYLSGKFTTFLCARTPRDAMKRSIEICLLQGQRNIYEYSSALMVTSS